MELNDEILTIQELAERLKAKEEHDLRTSDRQSLEQASSVHRGRATTAVQLVLSLPMAH